MLKRIVGPSPLLWGVKKIRSNISFRGGWRQDNNNICLSEEGFIDVVIEDLDFNNESFVS